MSVNQVGNGWAERLFLVGTNPDKIPERRHASQHSAWCARKDMKKFARKVR